MQRSHSQEDGWKFWVGLIISNVPIIVILAMMMTFSSTDSDSTFIALGYLLPTAGVWVGLWWTALLKNRRGSPHTRSAPRLGNQFYSKTKGAI